MKKPLKPAPAIPGNIKAPAITASHLPATEKKLTIGNDTWFDNADLKQMLHVSARTLLNWRRKGLLHPHNIGGKIYYCESELVNLTRFNRYSTKQ